MLRDVAGAFARHTHSNLVWRASERMGWVLDVNGRNVTVCISDALCVPEEEAAYLQPLEELLVIELRE